MEEQKSYVKNGMKIDYLKNATEETFKKPHAPVFKHFFTSKELPCNREHCEFKRKTKAGEVCIANRKVRRHYKCYNKGGEK